ncbi:MAG: TIGR00266 family protein [Nanoarchaeota archaeon]|nr:TIGR00266 family protein [Nanoarchaeota archaeon]
MAHEIDFKLYGDDLQIVEIRLDHNEAVRAEAGTMLFMEDGIEMQTSTGGGIWKGVKRMFTGEGFFITSFLNKGERRQHVAFGAPYPGKIIPLDLKKIGGEFICQRDSFLCAAEGIDIDIAFTKKLGAGFFGGEGFILQKLSGDGKAFVHAGGTIIEKDLKVGETLRVDTGCIVGFVPSIEYDIKFVGGFKNALFGGEGVFLALLRGPGKVYLQSLPFSRLADRIAAATYRNREQSPGVAGIGGDILGGILGGDRKF